MAVKTISKTKLMVGTALTAYILPRLAADKKIDVLPFLKGLTAKNYKAEIKGMVTKLCTDALPMMPPEAQAAPAKAGMGPDDVIHMLASHIIGGEEPSAEAMKTDEIPLGTPPAAPNEVEPPADAGNEALMAFLAECGLDETALAKVAELMGGAADPANKEAPVPGDEENKDKDTETKDEIPVTKEAMDKAIAKAARDSAAAVKAEMTATAEAREFVRAWVGTVPMAHDSAVKVYHAACATLGIAGADKVNDSNALKMLIESKPKAGARIDVPANITPAMDSALADELAKKYPHAASIKLG